MRSQDREWITNVKVNLLEKSHRNCDKICGCCQLHEIDIFHFILEGTWKFYANLKKGELKKFVTLGAAVTLKDTMYLENISFSL